jgi:protein TonB
VLTAPVNIPDVIPEIDLSKKLTNEADFSGKGVAGGVASGVVGGTGPVNQDQTFFDFQVEKPVAQIPGSGSPNYPDILRSASVEGQVLAQFVVDTLGRVEIATFKVITKTHDLFEASVRNALPRMRFLPAEVGGRKVKQLVQQPFVFNLNK